MAHKKILLIQDDAVEANVVSEALRGSFRVDWVRHCSEGMERLVREGKREVQAISAVLVDLTSCRTRASEDSPILAAKGESPGRLQHVRSIRLPSRFTWLPTPFDPSASQNRTFAALVGTIFLVALCVPVEVLAADVGSVRGEFNFPTVPVGDYVLSVGKADFTSAAQAVTVSSGS